MVTIPPSTIITDLGDPTLYSFVGFPMWTLYDHPTDFPDHFVMRLFDGMTGAATDKVFLAATIDEVHTAVSPHFLLVSRNEGDDSKIMAVYL